MKYTIKPGIAAIVHVHCEAFPMNYGERRSAFVFMAEGKPIERGIAEPIEWDALPQAVQGELKRHFGKVFSMPIEKRGEYLDNLLPWEIEA